MLKSIFNLSLLFFILINLISCSKEDTRDVLMISTCDDGIKNGDETGIDCGGSCYNSCLPENTLEGVIITRLVLIPNIEYILTGPLLVRDGAILEILAGTVIKAQKNKNAYIAIAQGGKIYTWGNETDPVVITSGEANPQPGDWGGIIICGKAPTNNGINARSELVDIFYGGTDSNFSSGLLRYLRLEYTGATSLESKVFNGITFYGVGSFTTVEHIQTYKSLGNGFEIVGGTINPKYLISTDSNKNGIEINSGWNGSGDSWYLSNFNASGIKLGNNKNNPVAVPLIAGNIDNVSIIGPESTGSFQYTDGGGVINMNDIYTSNSELGININGTLENTMVENGNLRISNIQFDNTTANFKPTNFIGSNIFFTEAISIGAGNSAGKPDWANYWSIGF